MLKIEGLLTHSDESVRRFAKGESKFKELSLKDLNLKKYPSDTLNCHSLYFENCLIPHLPKKFIVKQRLNFLQCKQITDFTNISFPTTHLEFENCKQLKTIEKLKIKRLVIWDCPQLEKLQNIEANEIEIYNCKKLKEIRNIKTNIFYLSNFNTRYLENIKIHLDFVLEEINEKLSLKKVSFNNLDLLERISRRFLIKLLKGKQ